VITNDKIILPFLKWAGGKRWLVQHQEFEIPTFEGRYIEPFLGSASVFFALRPRDAILSDVNAELIGAYKAMQTQYELVLRHLKGHARQHCKKYYYHVRDAAKPTSLAGRAARFLYLNRTCWNGLYRVNLDGHFNVPKGTKSSVLLDTDDFVSTARALANVQLHCSDFEPIVDKAQKGDLIYADPPYTVHHNTNGFIKYNEVLFSWEDQTRLLNCLIRARARGAAVVVSNANHPSILKLYSGIGRLVQIDRASVISGKATGRKVTSEVLIRL
jgi:DNA adenine methylase